MRIGVVLFLVGSLAFLSGCRREVAPVENGAAPAPPVYTGPEPLVVVEYFGAGNFWNVTPTLEQPSFVLYGDGTVIVRRGTENPSTYVRAKLDPEAVARLVADLDRAAIESLDGQMLTARTASDQGSEVLHVRRDDGTFIKVHLYGWWSESEPDDRGTVPLPEPVNRAFCAVTHLDIPESTPWSPQQYEVYVQSDFLNRRDTPVDWPTGWPTPQRESGDALYEIARLANVDPAEVAAVLGSPVDYSPKRIRIGRTIHNVRYRPVFPYEELWRRIG